jgi:hypothetical protein
LRFLVALDQDVEIVVTPHRDRHNAPALHVSSGAPAMTFDERAQIVAKKGFTER